MPSIVFLFSELSYYFLAGLRQISSDQVQITVVRWDVNPDAPFEFRFPDHVNFFKRSELNDDQLTHLLIDLSPQVIFCAGWLDKGYLSVLKKFPDSKRVLTMDNQWTGSPRQRLAALATRFTFISMFDAIWVPGKKQKEFAKRLGFKEDEIHLNFYSADLLQFNEIYEKYRAEKLMTYPHILFFLGRYSEEKGLDLLIRSFEKWKGGTSNDWKLMCAGTGPLGSKYEDTDDIKHMGFIQPYDLGTLIHQVGAFVLPSTFEPWGLVVHECVASGLPVISSEVVGSAEVFVKPENGWIIKAGSETELIASLDSLASKSDEELNRMSSESHRIGQTIRPEMWSEKLLSFLSQHEENISHRWSR